MRGNLFFYVRIWPDGTIYKKKEKLSGYIHSKENREIIIQICVD